MRGAALILIAVALAGCTASPPAPSAPTANDPAPDPSPATPIASTGPAATPTLGPTAPGPAPEDPPPVSPEPAPPSPEPTTPAGPEAEAAPPSPTPTPPPPAPAPAPSEPSSYAVRFQPGADAPDGRRFLSLTIAPDGGSFAASVRGVPEARLRIDSIARLANADGATREVRLSTQTIGDAAVTEARLLVGGTPMDMRAAEPNLTLFLSPGAVVDLGFEIALGSLSSGDVVLQRSVVLDVR